MQTNTGSLGTLVRRLAGIFACSALAALLVLAFAMSLPKDTNDYLFVLRDKHALLESREAPRIVLIGGSNLVFGLDSGAIEAVLGIPVVNASVGAGLGLQFVLDDLEPFLGRGDLVVIVPEYDQYFGNLAWGNMDLPDILMNVVPGRVTVLRPPQFANVKFVPELVRRDIGRFISRWRRTGVYQRRNFSSRGDMTAHLGLPQTPGIETARFAGVRNPGVPRMLDGFAARAGERGAECVLVYPPFRDASFARNEGAIRSLDRALRATLKLPILGTPDDFRFPDELFYDSAYHLGAEGTILRTDRLAGLLAGHLAARPVAVSGQ